MVTRVLACGAVMLSAVFFAGCKTNQATIIDPFTEDVEKPVVGWGLRKLDPSEYPDMRQAFMDKAGLERAIDKSLQFLKAPSSQRFYPSMHQPEDTITHAQVEQSLLDFKRLINSNMTPDQFQAEIVNRYDVYTSKGYNDKGDVWFTGYYTPIYQGSLVQTSEFKYPVYKRPADLVSDPITGDVQGRRMPDGTMQPYPTRKEIMASGMLKGSELVWFRDPMEPYIIQVQGSAKVILPDGKPLMIGYAGKNGREYRGLGSELVKDGKIQKTRLSLPAVLEYFKNNPGEQEEYVSRNDSFAFLKIYEPSEWPSGSLGVQVTQMRSLATDKSIFPRASMCFIDTPKPTADGTMLPYRGFILDQDTGGAIRAAGRADIYMGIGEEAGKLAGQQFAKGRLYYLFLKQGNFNPNLKPVKPAPNVTTPAKTPTKPAGSKPSPEIFPGAKKQ